ncbi:transposase [Verrucomicrobium spinosum]|uniref:transposase n=1 Tax=Verrucomicrobium spinosum TaxID=2736 RepID=UPI00017458D2|nr:transposase [Verrucomicrobium spinosum]
MKVYSRSIYTCRKDIPSLKFAPAEHLTAFGGLVIFMKLFERLDLWSRINRCFAHLPKAGGYTHGVMIRCRLVHLLLGCRHLRERDFYAHDPLVRQCLGLLRIPSVPTLSRLLASTDETSVEDLRQLNLQPVLDRLAQQGMRTLTLDFDGSVLSTSRHAQGTAVSFNKQKKGARS